MNVHLTDDQKAFIRRAIETGRFQREEDAVQEALALWEDRERTRAEILADVDLAEASLAQGRGRTITEDSMRELASEVKERGRAAWITSTRRAEHGAPPRIGSRSRP